MARINLTDRYIQSRKAAAPGRRDDYFDGLVPGLGLRVTDRGNKSFVLVARYPMRPLNPTRRALGTYGKISLDEARQKARDWLSLIQKGIDPAVEEGRQRAAMRVMQANIHRRLSISDLEWLVLPALRLGQLRVVHDQRKPVAVVIWAKVSKEVDTRLQSGEIRLKPEDWNSGEHAWIVEILAPRLSSNQAAMQRILTETATAAFGNGKFKMRAADSKSKQSKIVEVRIRKKEAAAEAAI